MAAIHSAREYRAFARQCVDLAERSDSLTDRLSLLARSKTWLRLADARDKAAEERRPFRRFSARRSRGHRR
jgi:hypothetical protein